MLLRVVPQWRDSPLTFCHLRTYSRPACHEAEAESCSVLRLPHQPSRLTRVSLQADCPRGLLHMYPPVSLLSLALHKVIWEEA